MSSRVSLSIIAAITGAALMYSFITFFNIPVHTEHTLYSRIAVIVALILVAIGWLSIFLRRPQQGQPGQ